MPGAWACSSILPSSRFSSRSYSSTVSPLIRTRQFFPFDDELERKPDLRLDLRIDRALESHRANRWDSARPPHRAVGSRNGRRESLPAGAKQDAAVVVLDVPHVELQLEIAELLLRRQMAGAIGVDDLAQRLELRLAFGDVPLVEILAGRRRVFATVGRGQFPDPKIAKTVRVRQRFKPQITAAETMAQFGHCRDVKIVNRSPRWSRRGGAASPSGYGKCSTRPCS